MCEHNEHDEYNNYTFKIVTAVVLFLIAYMCPYGILFFILSYVIAGFDVIKETVKNLFKGKFFDENSLMFVATAGAIILGEYPEASMVMILYTIGEYLQDRAIDKSGDAVSELLASRAEYAYVERDGQIESLSAEQVKSGEIIVVKSGQKVPLDGVVILGSALIDTSALTGESVPKTYTVGEKVFGGYINVNGVLKIKVSGDFESSAISEIIKLVETAKKKKSKTEKFITKFAGYYTPIVFTLAILIAVIPSLITGHTDVWISRALIFLVISCPCALVISVPLGFYSCIGKSSKHGILIKGSTYIEALSKAGTVFLDKTGTLTKGIFTVTKTYSQVSRDELLRLASAVESFSNHPIAASIRSICKEDISDTDVFEYSEISGMGVKAKVQGDIVLAGNEMLMNKFNIKYLKNENFGTVVYVARNGVFLGSIVISDEIKEDAYEAITELKDIANVGILTGDNTITAEAIGKELGIDEIYAELMPSDKVKVVEEWRKEKSGDKSVIFAGDGINDAPVLTEADVGIAMGGLGTDVAIDSADVVIMDDKLSKIPFAIKISQKTMSVVKQNIVLAISAKMIFLFLGCFGWVSMWGAVFADVGITLIAIFNSLKIFRD